MSFLLPYEGQSLDPFVSVWMVTLRSRKGFLTSVTAAF